MWLTLRKSGGIIIYVVYRSYRDVAQFGRALRSGRRGRRFKSCHPDQNGAKESLAPFFFVRKNKRPLSCFSSFVRCPARFACSVVNAFATALCRYQLFTTLRLRCCQALILLYFYESPIKILTPNVNGNFDKKLPFFLFAHAEQTKRVTFFLGYS